MNAATGTGGEQAAIDAADHGPSQSLEQFADLVRRYQSGVCAAAYGVTGDRALSEDIAQETFVTAWRSLSTLRDPSKLREWLRGIARNLARKAKRKIAPVEELGSCARCFPNMASRPRRSTPRTHRAPSGRCSK